jgi:hypothetical protein
VDEFFEILAVLREVDFRCDDWVEPALDHAPNAWLMVRIGVVYGVLGYELENNQGALWMRTAPRDSG